MQTSLSLRTGGGRAGRGWDRAGQGWDGAGQGWGDWVTADSMWTIVFLSVPSNTSVPIKNMRTVDGAHRLLIFMQILTF